MSTNTKNLVKIGVDSSSRFPFKAQIDRDRQTKLQTPLISLPHASATAGVGNKSDQQHSVKCIQAAYHSWQEATLPPLAAANGLVCGVR